MADRVSANLVATNVTGSVQVKNGSGRIIMMSITTVGGPIDVHDSATIGGIGATTLLARFGAAAPVGPALVDLPFLQGLVIAAGAGVCSVGYV